MRFMTYETARILSQITCDFYARVSSSFSDTRQAPWGGWGHVLDAARDVCAPGMRVLDLGCGNLRFERFLASRISCENAPATLHAWACDNCPSLVEAGGAMPPGACVRFRALDIAGTLFDAGEGRAAGAQALCRAIDAPPCDLSVAFGLMHHLALPEHRLAMLEALAAHTCPDGYVVASFWQFANSEKLLAKARAATEEGCAALGLPPLGPNDYLLGWQHEQGVYRFCHHFPESEIDELAHALEPRAREIARFSADGKTHNLNRYVVLQVR